MDAKNLSERLYRVASYVKQDARLADIGSDHAYLPANLALNKVISYGIAGEIADGPYQNAVREIKEQGLTNIIKVRLADGLAAIKKSDEIDTITICGMGGTLICDILKQGILNLSYPRLILQPNVSEENVRRYLNKIGYKIISEEILKEDEHIYEIIVAQYNNGIRQTLVDEDFIFGLYLRQKKSSIYLEKWAKEKRKLLSILEKMNQAKLIPISKKEKLKKQIALIEKEATIERF